MVEFALSEEQEMLPVQAHEFARDTVGQMLSIGTLIPNSLPKRLQRLMH